MIELLFGSELGAAGELVFAGPGWWVAVAIPLGVVAIGLTWLGKRSLMSRISEVVCWSIAVTLVIVALSQPTWVEEEGRTEPGRVAVLVDASKSMSVLEYGKARSEAVEEVLRQFKSSEVDIYHFGSDLRVGAPDAFNAPSTDFQAVLDALNDRVAGEKLASVVIISDGLDRGTLRQQYAREALPAAPRVPGPLTVYQIGTAADLKDVSIRSVDAGGYAFRSEPFTVTADLDSVGFAGQSVLVSLSRDGRPVTQKQVTLGEDGSANVQFEVRPQSVGRFTYEVSIPVADGDAVPSNNRAPVVVRVVRDRISVLQVAGAPSWDVKFMRRFLKGDPSVDLVSFFILRTEEDIDRTDYRDRELSLIQFPYQDLFSTELERFDVVIFQNFDQNAYFSPRIRNELLDNIRAFVEEEGKGFVMIGGDKSFDLGGYGGTPIDSILPVQLAAERSSAVSGDRVSLDSFRPKLTDAGERHPITKLRDDPMENTDWWSQLVPLDGTNIVSGVRPGTTVLLRHPELTDAAGAGLPVLAVREAGEGRAMALTVDTSWRWSLSEAAAGRGNQAYLRFWKNSFRWLVKDPSTNRVTVSTGRENYAVDDEVRIVVRAQDEAFAALNRAEVTVLIEGPEGEESIEQTTSVDGDVAIEWTARHRGPHRVAATVKVDGKVVGTDETVFAVTTRDPELDEVIPDEAFLRWLASSVDGAYFGPGQTGDALVDRSGGRKVWDRRETPLWRAPVLGFAVLLFGGLAWIVRRRSGLR